MASGFLGEMLSEPWHFGCCNCPHLAGIDPVVMMRQHGAEPDHVLPGHFRVAGTAVVAQGTSGLSDDLQ